MHDKEDKLNQPMHMARHILSPSSCTHFSPSIIKLPWKDSNIIPHRWTHFIMMLKCYKSTDVIRLEPQTMKISHYIFNSKIILFSIFYFVIIVLVCSYYYVIGMLSAHQFYTARATNHIKNKVILYSWSQKHKR